MTGAGGAARRVTLSVPGLADPPLLSGCCAVGRDDVLLEELDSWPGLLVLEVDPDAATAVVLLAPGSDDLPAALEALADRGLPACVLSAERNRTLPL
jgi:hypothetical protein